MLRPVARDSTTLTVSRLRPRSAAGPRVVPALVLAWSAAEPWRVGEVALLDPKLGPYVFGRGDAPSAGEASVAFVRQRPSGLEPQPSLQGPGVSRRQLLFSQGKEGTLHVRRVGRCPVSVSGNLVEEAEIAPGDVLELDQQLTFLCTTRPLRLPSLDAYPDHAVPPFGEPDPHGIVGESPAVWLLREQLGFAAVANQHVLLLGESGSGKELAAHAIHALSPRASKALVARNAATLPPGIIDAELFGNVRDYPNPGMRERPGIIGEADGSTLFLDEIGELPQDMQAHLLRVLDANGEYQRLGDARTRRAQLRLVAATNRDPDELKHDLLARLTLRVSVPGLDQRAEDIPLLVRRLVLRAAQASPPLGQRFLEGWDGSKGEPRVAQKLVGRMLRMRCEHHVRDLDQMLWRAMSTSRGGVIEDTQEVQEAFPVPTGSAAGVRVEPSADEIREALRSQDGNVTQAARVLGLPSRFVLYRLMRKLGVE
jgi:two-component system nitrogen regulation response regulator GlnG/two-component system response regulator HydG